MLNARQLLALKNPCHFEDQHKDAQFELIEILPGGSPARTEIRVFNYFGMMIWIAGGSLLGKNGNEILCANAPENSRSELQNMLRGFLKNLGKGEIREMHEGSEFAYLREVAPGELKRMPAPPFGSLLNATERQAAALKNPVKGLQSMLTGNRPLIVAFGITRYSTLLTIDDYAGETAWHASVSVLSEDGNNKPQTCYTVRATEFEQAMEMMQALLGSVGAGHKWTNKPQKSDVAFHLFRKLSADEMKKLPQPKLSEKILPEFIRAFTRN